MTWDIFIQNLGLRVRVIRGNRIFDFYHSTPAAARAHAARLRAKRALHLAD